MVAKRCTQVVSKVKLSKVFEYVVVRTLRATVTRRSAFFKESERFRKSRPNATDSRYKTDSSFSASLSCRYRAQESEAQITPSIDTPALPQSKETKAERRQAKASDISWNRKRRKRV